MCIRGPKTLVEFFRYGPYIRVSEFFGPGPRFDGFAASVFGEAFTGFFLGDVILSYQNKEAILFSLDPLLIPCSGNLN